jgi:hypothetical protein
VFELKVDKMMVDGPGSKWKVKGELSVKYKGRKEELERVEQHLNSKTAEESVVKYLVVYVYDKYPEIL